MHTFYGPQSGVDPRRVDSSDKLELHAKLLATAPSENTGNVEENKSLYWHPTVYKFDRSTNTYTRDVMAQTSAYYVWETGEATAFPDGFRMIGGYDVERSHAAAECVGEAPCDDGDCHTENAFFPASRCDELEVSMTMPNCWDGFRVDSPPEHVDHVAYAEGGVFDGDCPASHPVRVPQIWLFFRIFDYDGGWHTFSDGSSVFHADYVSGWDVGFLQRVLDRCDNEGFGPMPNFFCEDMLTFRDSPKCTDEDACDFADPALLEKLRAFQPPPLDVEGTIVAEPTQRVVGDLPRGTCQGSFVDEAPPSSGDPSEEPTDPSSGDQDEEPTEKSAKKTKAGKGSKGAKRLRTRLNTANPFILSP